WSGPRPPRASLLHLAQGATQRAEPGVLVLPDQAHAPGERVAAAAGRPGIDERVEHPALGLAQPGHNRGGKCGEHHFPPLAHHAPGNLTAEPPLRLARDPDPRLPRLLTEPPAPPHRNNVRPGLTLPLGIAYCALGRLLAPPRCRH